MAAATRWPMLGALVVFLLWGLHLRDGQRAISRNDGVALPTAPEALLGHVGDPYLIVFFVVPVYIALVTTSMTASADYPVLARVRSSPRWLLWGLRTDLAATAVLIAVLIVAGVVTTLGLRVDVGPVSAVAMKHDPTLRIIAEQPGGASASVLLLVVAQVLLLGVGLLALRTLLAVVFLLTRSLGVLALVGAGLWIATLMSFFGSSPYLVGPLDALTLHQAVRYLPWWATTAIPAAAIAVLLCLAWALDQAVAPARASTVAPALTWPMLTWAAVASSLRRPGVAYGTVVVLAVAAVAPQVAATATSPWDVFLATAWGTSPEGVSAVGFSLFNVIFVGFAYLVSTQLDTELGDRLPYVMIRHRSLRAWTLRLLARFAAQGAVLVAGVLALTAGLGHLLVDVPPGAGPVGVMTSSGALITMSAPAVHQFALNGVLQLLTYSTALFLLLWWTRSSVVALGALAAIAVLSLPGANAGGWIPVGLNSVGMLTAASPTRMSAELVVLDVVLIIAALWSVTQSGATTTERS